jgi:hypothetical protein
MFLLERLVLALLCLLLLPTVGTFVRWIGGLGSRGLRKLLVELYVVAKTFIAGWILWSNSWNSVFFHWLAVYCLAELFLNLAAVVLLRDFWRRPISWNRSLILAAFNFYEFTSWFAILYLYHRALIEGQSTVTESGAAFYFSVITASTVGYGDITPTAGIGRTLAIIQISLSLCFIAAVIAYFISSLNSPSSNVPASEPTD